MTQHFPTESPKFLTWIASQILRTNGYSSTTAFEVEPLEPQDEKIVVNPEELIAAIYVGGGE